MTRHKTSSRLLAMLLSLMSVIGMLPTTVFAAGDVAYIGNTGYPTLAQAVSSAYPGDTILLTADDAIEQKIEISKNLTIELDGHSLPGTAFKITGGTVIIGDRKGTGTINENNAAGFKATEGSNNSSQRCASTIHIVGNANVTLNNLRVEQCAEDDLEKAIFLGQTASLTINGGSYTGPKNAGVDAIFYDNDNSSSSLTINDGHFESNCGLSVNKTPGTGGGTLVIRKATFVGNGTAFWIEQENGGVTTQAKAERFLADSSGSYIIGTFDKANIVIGSSLFVSDGFTGPEYGSTDSDNPAQLIPEEGESITLLPQILGGDGSGYTYTWYKDSQVISDATGSSYTIENYQSSEDDGIYSVTVSQGNDSVTVYWKIGDVASIPQLPGEGTEQAPYEISTPEQLMAFAQLVNSGSNAVYAKLIADIDMSGQSWTGISINSNYTGVFDGQGHIISNLTGTEGLFVNNAGTVKNVRLENVALTKEGGNLGAVVGVNTGTVFNCISSGSITGTGSNAYSIGGLIGHNNGGALSGSFSSCTVGGKTAGGLAGSNWNDGGNYGKITACIYTGNAENPVEGDKYYSNSTNVYYKDSNSKWKSYPGNSATNENAVLQSVNGYIAENGGTFILSGDGTTYPTSAVSYLDYTEDGLVTKYIENYTTIDSSNIPTEWTNGWYVVDGEVAIPSRVTVTGDVKLILKDGANLTVNGGIDVSGTSNSFTIYAQSTDESKMGSLTATAAEETGDAGIGSSDGQTAGAITINGGKINATGGSRSVTDFPPGAPSPEEKVYTGAGIGGGEKSGCSTITINGGIVMATSGKGPDFWETSNSAGIGNGGQNRSDLWYDETPVGTIVINGGSVSAKGMWWGAGIGGGDGMPIASVTINGGVVKAESDRSAGIGNGGAGNGGIVTTTGGTVNAVSEFACGIGGGYISDIESVVITGGDITATSESGAGLGSCAYQTTAEVTISGGRVTATSNEGDGIGMGDTFRNDLVDFSTGTNGHAVIFASSIADQTGKDAWSGLIFVDNNGKIYGDSYTVEEGLTIPSDKILTIENGKTLIIPEGVTFDFAGEIRLDEGGQYNGDLPSGSTITYQIQWDTDGDGTVDDTTYVEAGVKPTHDNGSKKADAQYTYIFTGWSPELAVVTGPAKYTAEFDSSLNQYTVTLPSGEGYTITTDQNTTVGYGSNFTFTLNIKDGYSTTEEFAVKANGEPPRMDGEYNYTATVTGDTVITVEGVADTTAPSNLTVSYETNGFKEFLNTITFGLFFKDTVTVTISATDEGSGVKEISYKLGDGSLQTVETQNGSISFTVEPEFKGNIKNVTATDNAGNTAEGIDYEYFAVEKNKPADVTVDINGYESGKWTNGDVTITVSGSTATSGIAKYQYSTDGGKTWHDMTATEKTDATATDPLNVTKAQLIVSHNGTADYIFRAVSGAGNESTSSNPVAVKIDKVQPTIAATGDTDSYLTGDTILITADAGESGITSVEVQTDSDSWTDITDTYSNGYTVTANGTYNFRVTNGAGATATDSITYDRIDSVKPELVINSGEYTNNTWTNGDVTLSVSNTANNLGSTTVQYKVDDGEWQSYTNEITVSSETDGTTYTFKATSASGVASDEASITVKIDKTASEGDITIEQNSVKKFINAITFGLFFNKNVDVTITGTDNLSGVAAVEYYRSEEILTEDEVLAIGNWTAYSSISETAEDSEKFIYYVKITDYAGNVTYFGSDGVTFDLTAPVISGVTGGATYYTTQIVTVADENFASVTVNDVVQSDAAFTLPGNAEKTYTIAATDKAGNVTTYEVTMKPIASLAETIEDITNGNVTSEDKGTVETVKEQVKSIDLEDATEDEKEALQEIFDKCDSLTDQIEETAEKISSLKEDVAGYSENTVTSSDKDAITQLRQDILDLISSGNLSEEEKAEMQTRADKCESLSDKIEQTAQAAANLEEALQSYDPSSVTSGDKETIEQLKEDLQNLINSGNLTGEEKAEMEELVDSCDAMLEEIAAAGSAGSTENTDKVENVSSDNVKPEDKDDLTQAKEDLENALKNFGDNYTEEERAELEEKLEQINNALDVLEKVETVQGAITSLPDAVEPDDTKAETHINTAKEQYDQLTEYEKSLLPDELKEKLESLLENLLDYRIIAGNGSQWTAGDDGSIVMTANGPVEKFIGIEVNGKAVDSGNYTVKSGSTIITLKPEYLNTLSAGKHTLTVIYTDGETSGAFEIVMNTETATPETGDNSNIAFWMALMFMAACALTGTMAYSQKRKYSK